jgi:hypothetical protein
VAIVAVGSLALSLVWTDTAAPWAFFSLPTRAWELAIGALIATGTLRLPRRAPSAAASALVWAGLALIAISVILVDASTPYPGTAALLPVIGTALVIVGGSAASSGPSRWLSMPVPRWLGRISYSLYLWHWPILVLIPIALRGDGLALRLLLAGVAIAIAAVSTELIEAPFRRGRVLRVSALRSVGVAGMCSVAVAAGALAAGLAVLAPSSSPAVVAADRQVEPERVVSGASTPEPGSAIDPLPAGVLAGPLPSGLDPPLEQARDDLPRSYSDGCHLDFATVEPGECAYARRRSKTTAVLVGDSHAAQWLPAVEGLAATRGWRLLAFTKSGCPMVDVSVWNFPLKRDYRECGRWREHVLARMRREAAAVAFVANSRMYEVVDAGGRRGPAAESELWPVGLVSSLQSIARVADHVVMLGDTPRLDYDPLECLASNDAVEDCETRRVSMVDADYAAEEAAAASDADVARIATDEWVCPEEDCPLVRGTMLVYRDHHHLTATFARALAPLLGAALDAAGVAP